MLYIHISDASRIMIEAKLVQTVVMHGSRLPHGPIYKCLASVPSDVNRDLSKQMNYYMNFINSLSSYVNAIAVRMKKKTKRSHESD